MQPQKLMATAGEFVPAEIQVKHEGNRQDSSVIRRPMSSIFRGLYQKSFFRFPISADRVSMTYQRLLIGLHIHS